MKRSLYFRLSAMFFLQYMVNGAVLPVFSHYLLNYLHFSPDRIGIIMGMPALAALVAPAFAGQVADRFISAERMLALCHFLAGAVMFVLSFQKDYGPFLWLYVLYSLLFVPTLALTNTVGLHHAPDARKDFARVRMWGTVGWVAVAWVFGLLWLNSDAVARLGDALRLSAGASWVLAVYALTLPRSTHAGPPPPFAPWRAIRLFLQPNLLTLTVAMFLNSVVTQFYYFGTAPYLSSLGVGNRALMPLMSLGQISEVVMVFCLPPIMARLGFKRLLLLGTLAQLARFVLFAFLPAALPIALGISAHGIHFALFFLTAYIYLDLQSGPSERARAQQFINIVAFGLGSLAGFGAAGRVAQALTSPAAGVDYHRFWMVPAALSLVMALTLVLFFREEKAAATRPAPQPVR